MGNGKPKSSSRARLDVRGQVVEARRLESPSATKHRVKKFLVPRDPLPVQARSVPVVWPVLQRVAGPVVACAAVNRICLTHASRAASPLLRA